MYLYWMKFILARNTYALLQESQNMLDCTTQRWCTIVTWMTVVSHATFGKLITPTEAPWWTKFYYLSSDASVHIFGHIQPLGPWVLDAMPCAEIELAHMPYPRPWCRTCCAAADIYIFAFWNAPMLHLCSNDLLYCNLKHCLQGTSWISDEILGCNVVTVSNQLAGCSRSHAARQLPSKTLPISPSCKKFASPWSIRTVLSTLAERLLVLCVSHEA